MQLYCTRPNCPSPLNNFPSLDNPKIPRPIKQKYCSACRMEMILGGRYLPLSVLGKGGFGTAFLARDIDSPTKRKCVVKLFQPPVTLTPSQMATAQRLFATEAEVLERFGLQHPQIPNLYAYFPLLITNPLTNQTEELFYLVQEFVDGEDLEQILDRGGAFSEADVLEVLREMLKVLDFVHSNGAIHRDVKPSNIMKGRSGKLYLLDFGAVKEVATPSAGQGVVGQGVIGQGVIGQGAVRQRGPTTICSPDYAPPEQIMNGIVSATSDLYALAATCVTLLTNKGSNELRDSSTNSWNWHSHTQVSGTLVSVLDRMLQARPDDRFPSAKAVLAALSPHIHSASINPAGINPTGINPTGVNPASINPGARVGSAQPFRASQSTPSIGIPVAPPPMPAGQPSPPPLAPRPAAKLSQPTQANVSASSSKSAPRSLIGFLGSAAFTGVEGGLLAIAAFSLMSAFEIIVIGIVWLSVLAALVSLQIRRVIEGWDFLIIAGFTMAAVILIGPLNSQLSDPAVLVPLIAVMAGGAMVLIAAFFRLVFQILTRIM